MFEDRNVVNVVSAQLPPELHRNILSRLPADNAIQCKLVCKTWKKYVEDPDFPNMHTRQLLMESDQGNFTSSTRAAVSKGVLTFYVQNKSAEQGQRVEYYDDAGNDQGINFKVRKRHTDILGPREVLLMPSRDNKCQFTSWATRSIQDYATIVGSSNGLICVYKSTFQVLNPFIKEHVLLPFMNPFIEIYAFYQVIQRPRFVAYGFGYCPSTKEYKVVCISYKSRFSETGLVQVYTLGSGTWRSKGEITHSWELNSSRAIFMDGALYWITTKMEMVCFHLEDEEVRVIQSPKPPPRRPPSVARNLVALGGCLCVVFVDKESNVMDIWEMGNDTCWTEKLSMPCKSSEDEAFAYSQSGKLLLQNSGGIISCDPKAGSSTYIYYWQDSRSCREFIPYVASFISLEALGEEVVSEDVVPPTTSDQILNYSSSSNQAHLLKQCKHKGIIML